ncbi:hypothetical protein HanIR_Chr14g0692211 [Helianthus annuus]|nr:hypothetical protein HanIR_Chr14g0692211 [Helianthus annuus]
MIAFFILLIIFVSTSFTTSRYVINVNVSKNQFRVLTNFSIAITISNPKIWIVSCLCWWLLILDVLCCFCKYVNMMFFSCDFGNRKSG